MPKIAIPTMGKCPCRLGISTACYRVTLHADGSAEVITDQVRAAKWTKTANSLVLSYDAVITAESFSDDFDPGLDAQNTIKIETLATSFSRLTAELVQVVDTTRTTYLDGNRSGQIVNGTGGSQSFVLVHDPKPITAFDVASGTGWAGLWRANGAPNYYYSQGVFAGDRQDILRIDGSNTAHMDIVGGAATWQLVNGSLVVTQGDSVVRYSRLFKGPWGEERWLAENLSNNKPVWVADMPVMKAQADVKVTTFSLVGNWVTMGYSGNWGYSSKYAIGGDGAVNLVSESVDPRDENFNSTFLYGYLDIPTDGATFSFQRWYPNGLFSEPVCKVYVAPCQYYRGRYVNVVSKSGNILYVMEYLDFNTKGIKPFLD